MLFQPVKFVVLPGGKLPSRNPEHGVSDAGLDCYVRAIVSTEPDEKTPSMRKTLWDFCNEYYSLLPGESVSVGLGFNVQIPFGMAGFIYPRGSSIVKNGERIHLKVLNKNPIDHGFTGEPWVELRNDGETEFSILHGSKLVQLVIQPVWCGPIREVGVIRGGPRGHKSNGSTGH